MQAGIISAARAITRKSAAGAIRMVLRRVTGWAPSRLVRLHCAGGKGWQSCGYCYGAHHEQTLNAWHFRQGHADRSDVVGNGCRACSKTTGRSRPSLDPRNKSEGMQAEDEAADFLSTLTKG